MKILVTALFAAVSVVVVMLLGKCIASSRDFMTRAAIVIASLLLWTACVWLLLLFWRNGIAS
jgi:hypothetical protein